MKTINRLSKIESFRSDPLGFIADLLISVIVNLFIPIPLAGQVLQAFRGPIIGCLASAIILGLFMLVVIGTIILSPFIVSSSFLQRFSNIPVSNLNIAFDDSFYETSIPQQNPFGGPGMAYTSITAHFLDPRYFLNFGRIHTGVDFVPTDTYFSASKTYAETGQIVIFSTINGTSRTYIDQYGGKTVEVTNAEDTYRVVFIHFKQVLVGNESVRAGTPIGIMGKTGRATGEHLHYEVRVKQGSNWQPVNPLGYIQ